ncbi:MAG TPA: sulfatase-like hydrolase/transferase [Actinophytocola sp.]|uniref:sulfatase-like hydrolase/transferase n=1 Tax=Actinophytocola sp. TaxID=1872138 RepID=UPI002DDD3E17|nr:sulfatase-like hydrolase/transferase [Actinophytocola sp.]HEV2781369.1 sulfatase-like hydrolase/transferase [Actinophytocola sp.]
MSDLSEKNVVFVTVDSCRYDVARAARIPFIRSIGELRRARTHGSFTVPAHHAFFAGHLPVVLEEPLTDYYSEAACQLWRIKTGRTLEEKRRFGLLFGANNVVAGYRALGFKVLGAGGVSQFSDGSCLRAYFGDDFLYFGPNLDEEPLRERDPGTFPLNNIETIVRNLAGHDKWFLFVNCPETHYPYDIGNGIPADVLESYATLKGSLNLREGPAVPASLGPRLREMQLIALEYLDGQLGKLFELLPRRRDIVVIVCGDHGENFGEHFAGKPRWGHMVPSREVMEVPLVIGQIDGCERVGS